MTMSSCGTTADTPKDATLPGALDPTPFAKAYPAPWRILGDDVVDADGGTIRGFDVDNPDELAFWRGIVLAVNIRETLIEELQHTRHYVAALAKRAPDIAALQNDLARLDLVIQQSGAR